ncbi:MAG: helix-turn-helix domain-containing protein [Clostridia bacterium]|nr:helix-turn-helix domain-containing protein [Clostridia bacterium]
MNQLVFAENMKKFRQAKKYTQEQVAEKLCVNAQTVSRWECAATLPDVLLLPEIAKLYGVMVDDLFKKQSVAYENYAQRLASVYELSEDPEDFLRCRLEYQKMMKNGELSLNDKWNYAAIHHQMMYRCKEEALKWYDAALACDADKEAHAYRRAASMKQSLLFYLGQGEAVIKEQQAKIDGAKTPPDAREWILLIDAYLMANRHAEAYEVYRRAIELYSDHWELYLLGGDCCGEMERYDEAFACFEKAEQLGDEWCSVKHLMAYYYEKQGKYQKAYDTIMEIAGIYRKDGFDIESDMELERAKEIKEKIK